MYPSVDWYTICTSMSADESQIFGNRQTPELWSTHPLISPSANLVDQYIQYWYKNDTIYQHSPINHNSIPLFPLLTISHCKCQNTQWLLWSKWVTKATDNMVCHSRHTSIGNIVTNFYLHDKDINAICLKDNDASVWLFIQIYIILCIHIPNEGIRSICSQNYWQVYCLYQISAHFFEFLTILYCLNLHFCAKEW